MNGTDENKPGAEDVIRIMCPHLTCKRVLAVPAAARGKLVRCRGCGMNLRIPAPKVPAMKSTSAAARSDTPAPASAKSSAGGRAT